VEKPAHELITEEGTVKKPHLEICIPSKGNSVTMYSLDLCDDSSSGVTGGW